MQAFAFHRPNTLAAAVKAAAADDAKLIAGGQTLLQAMKLGLAAPESLVDLAAVEGLKGIAFAGGQLSIGAGSTHAAVAASPLVQQHIPALAALAGGIGDRQVRHRGTLGGSLANNDPAACYPAAVLAMGATVHTDRRRLSAEAFFTGLYSTALEPDEIITSVSFPVPQHAGWQKFKQPASRFSLVGVFVSKGPAGVRVAVTGAGANGVFRARDLEDRLSASYSGAALSGASVSAEGINSDMHGSAAYRAALITVLAARAVG